MSHHGTRCRGTRVIWTAALALLTLGSCSLRCHALGGSSAEPDFLDARPQGVKVLFSGPELQSFDRPLPDLVEVPLFREFEGYFNQTQDFSARGPNTYHASGHQVVVSISDGRVTGILGDVYDSQGRVYTEFSASPSMPARPQGQQECKRFKRLATVIQKYGHMYYHFIQEVIPRFILLQPFLDQDTTILSFGSLFEYKWLEELGISPAQIEIYDPTVEYCADELLVPSVSPIITPPKENYELLRTAFRAGVPTTAEQQQQSPLVIYCSRQYATERVVTNEAALLDALRRNFPAAELHVFTGEESVRDTVDLFGRARVVVGMHGAGLSHSIFSPPGTAVVEFLFMPDPPLMFWHAAAALGQRYVMVPLAQSWWLDPGVGVPEQDVVDAMHLALGGGGGAAVDGDCKLGYFRFEASGECMACPAGTYRPAGSSSCLPCAGGRISTAEGAAFCSTCPAGTFSDSGFECVACDVDRTTLFPGASSAHLCLTYNQVDTAMDSMFNRDTLTEKLLALPALQLARPKGFWQRLLALFSPQRWLQAWAQRQLKLQYLTALFDSDLHMRANEPDSWEVSADGEASATDEEAEGDSLVASALQQDSHSSSHRSLQGGFYPVNRRALQGGFYPVNRRSLQGGFYPVNRRSLQGGFYPADRRALHAGMYMSGRRSVMEGYGHRRKAYTYGAWMPGSRRMTSDGDSKPAGVGSTLVDLARQIQESTVELLLTRASTLPGGRMVQQGLGGEGGFLEQWRSFWAWVWRVVRSTLF